MIRLALILALLVAPAWAADRQSEIGGTVRLVLGPAQPGQDMVAGALVVDLAPGFKTYWKRPGDSGVPTVVDFNGSANLAEARLRFPTPALHEQPGDRTVSYKGRVAFPIEARRVDPSAPLTLKVSGMLGMCADICIPVPIDLEAETSPRLDPAAMPVLFAATNGLPRPAPPGIELRAVEHDAQGRVTAVEVDGPKVRPRPVLFAASDDAPDLVPYAMASGDGPYRFELSQPVRGPVEAVVAFGTSGARFDLR